MSRSAGGGRKDVLPPPRLSVSRDATPLHLAEGAQQEGENSFGVLPAVGTMGHRHRSVSGGWRFVRLW